MPGPNRTGGRLVLKPGREKSLLRRHPWVFSGAVGRIEGAPLPGGTIAVHSSTGEFLAWAAYSPHSQIRARVWSWTPSELVDRAFLRQRLQSAAALRGRFIPEDATSAMRLVHGESDGLPGLIVDRYVGALVVGFLSAGVEFWRETILDSLEELFNPELIYERSDVEVRTLEGLPVQSGVLRGREPDGPVTISEYGLKFQVDLRRGHKTGFYLDQRENRRRLRDLVAGREVLDCFAYSGGFSLNALAGGAVQVEAVDSSQEALDMLVANLELNRLSNDRVACAAGDVFQVLRKRRDQGRAYDVIVLDPPKFAAAASQAQRAARGYKDINLLALKLLRAGGLLLTFSCSGGVSPELFTKIVAGAALDAGCEARVVERFAQAPDHPVGLAYPEGMYLKGLLIHKS